MKLPILIPAALLAASLGFVTNASAQLKSSQAKNLIRRVAGSNLPSNAVQIKQIADRDSGSAEATAQIETAFRFQRDESGHWEVRDVRVAPDAWEDMSAIVAGSVSVPADDCDDGEPTKGQDAGKLGPKRARCLLANALSIGLPSDAIRIREISPLDLPLSTRPSATVVGTVQVDFRFERQNKGAWQISAFRTGNRDWARLDTVIALMDSSKREKAKMEMEALANALQNFRSKRGFYVASDKHPVLVDFLTPNFIADVVRLDPWHRPYQYQGERDRFTLSSDGPDKTPNTGDDIIFKRP